MKIFVFTLPTCVPCKALKEDLTNNEEFLKSKNIEVEILDMSKTNDYVLELATKYSIRSAPTVIMDTSFEDKSKSLNNFHSFKTFEQLKEHLSL